jgi:hypothetical protein
MKMKRIISGFRRGDLKHWKGRVRTELRLPRRGQRFPQGAVLLLKIVDHVALLLLRIDGDHDDLGLVDQRIEFAPTRLALPDLNDECRLEQCRR